MPFLVIIIIKPNKWAFPSIKRMSCSVLGLAKLDLYLEILGTRQQDAYHELALVMQSASLADRVTLWSVPDGTEFLCLVAIP